MVTSVNLRQSFVWMCGERQSARNFLPYIVRLRKRTCMCAERKVWLPEVVSKLPELTELRMTAWCTHSY